MSNSPAVPTYNPFHQDKWRITFSNMPLVENNKVLDLYDNTAKSISLPNYDLASVNSYFQGERIIHPDGHRPNLDLFLFQVTFKLTEDFTNYSNLFEWMAGIKYGKTEAAIIRREVIKTIKVLLLDNQKRTRYIISFNRALPTSLSSLGMNYGISSELDFTVTFNYEEIHTETVSIGI